MAFAAVGSAVFTPNVTTFSLTPGGAGDLILAWVADEGSTTDFASSLSSSNVTWAQMGTSLSNAGGGGVTMVLFAGLVTSTATATVTVAWTGTTPTTIRICTKEFSSTIGSWVLDVQGNVDTTPTQNTWASLTPAGGGELYAGFCLDSVQAVAGSTPGYTYEVDSVHGNGAAYNLSCAGGVATAPVWGDSTFDTGIMVLVRETPATHAPQASTRVTARRSRRKPQQAPPPPSALTVQGTATLAAAGSLTAAATLDAGTLTALSGTGSAGNAATQGSGGTMGGSGSVPGPDVTQPAPAALAGTAALATAITLGVTATLGGAGTLAGNVTLGVITALGAAGGLAEDVTLLAPAALAGTAALGNLDAATGAPGTLGGAGALATAAVQGVITTLGGAGALAAAVTLGVTAALGGAGTLAGGATQLAPAALAGTAALGNPDVTQLAPAVLAGTGSVTAHSGLPKTGPLTIILPGGFARDTTGPLTVALPAPALAVAALAGTSSVLAVRVPAPRAQLTGKVTHSPLRITVPAPAIALAGKVTHNPLRITVPAPRTALTGFRARAGPFTLVLGRHRSVIRPAAREAPPAPVLPGRVAAGVRKGPAVTAPGPRGRGGVS